MTLVAPFWPSRQP